jgi:hypothetical protein
LRSIHEQLQIPVAADRLAQDRVASGKARKTIMSASCCGFTVSLIEACCNASLSCSSGVTPRSFAFASNTRRMRSPSTMPGRIAFTRMPNSPSSMESDFVKPTTPHFAAA